MAGEEFIPVAAPIAGCVSASLGMFLHGMFVPSSRLFGPVVCRGPRESAGRVAITFDDGPAEGTACVLDILGEMGCRATFFLIGRNAAESPGLVARAAAEGHLIGNHSYDHSRNAIWRRRWYWEDQLSRTDAAIREAGGPERCLYYRPPMGFKSWRMAVAASRTDHRMVTWSLRGMDGVATTPEAILGRVLGRAGPGDIIALHDGAEPGKDRRPTATIGALPRLVRGLRERGLTPVRLDELLDNVTGGATKPAAASRA